ncbi:MAG: type IV toxin-antitoxin system AbiEi family antitoxin domain-containing protein [Propionibacteriaceae bacterium]|nr:type IV toxin-antitoxin system AbiEi family antitoxin domain-containing protein [Propionibacteriaceae bacterium]
MIAALTDLDRLREVALDQHGFVTTEQALDAGVTHPSLSMMVRRERLERVAHGLYRVPGVPASIADELMQAVLWTGFPEACLSHDSALDAWEISDINPSRIHVAVGAKRRITKATPRNYVVHKQDLEPRQVTWWDGIPTATATTAIEQCIVSGVPTYLLRQALERSAPTGLVPVDERKRLAGLLEARHGK